MNEELDVLKTVAERLNKAGVAYMISGSIACNYYTVPRMTRDIDVVVGLKNSDIDEFINLFQNDFYVDKEMVAKEVMRQGIFNIIHNKYVIKVDFIIRKHSNYQDTAFSRRKKVLIENNPMWFISAEDLILSKLLWAKNSHSEMQLRDIRNLMETLNNLDLEYIKKWISRLDLERIYKDVI